MKVMLRRSFSVLTITLFLPLLLLSQVSTQQTGVAIYNDAVEQIRTGHFEKGCAEVEQMIRKNFRLYAAYNLLGVCEVQRGNLEIAGSYFRKSVELDPGFTDARLNLGLNLLQRGKPKAAIPQLRKVLSHNPANVLALYRLGQAELATGSPTAALTHLRPASKLAPGNGQVVLALASALMATGQRREGTNLLARIIHQQSDSHLILSASMLALTAGEENLAQGGLQTALNLNPRLQEEIFNLARAQSLRQQYGPARVLLRSIGKYEENSSEWNALLGYAEYKLGNPSEAAGYLRRAIDLNPDAPDYYMKMGELLLRYNSDAAATGFFKAGLNHLPDSALLHYGLGVSYWSHQTNPDAAIAQLKIALRLDSHFQSALSLLCDIYYSQKRWTYLDDTAERLVRLNTQSPEGYYYKALGLMEGSQTQRPQSTFEEARRLLKYSLQLDPKFGESYVALGKLLIKSGDFRDAIACFQHAIRINPDRPEAYYHLAMAYRQSGDKRLSAKSFQQFKRLKAAEPGSYEVLFRVSK